MFQLKPTNHQPTQRTGPEGWCRREILLLCFFLVFFIDLSATGGDSLRHLQSLLEEPMLQHPSPEIDWLDRIDPEVPPDYLSQISDLLPVTPSGDNFTLVSWVDKDQHQIAEDPEGLSNTERILTEIQKAGRFFSKLDGGNLLNIPFGIQDTYGDIQYFIGFNNLRLYPDHASVDIVASLYLPVLGDTLKFAGANIKYNNRSGLVGDARLFLVQDFLYEVNKEKTALIIRGWREQAQAGTYIKVNCDGIEKITLGIEFLFNNDFIKPVDKSTDYIKAFSQVDYHQDSGLIISDVTIPPFYFRDLEDAAFALENLTIDLNESRSNIPYIPYYLNKLEEQGDSPGINFDQWTGFYCQNFQLIIGNQFISQNRSEPITVEGNHIIIDDLGFTAALDFRKPLLDLKEANVAGWPISINEIHLDILANSLKGFGFGGLIHVPVLDSKKGDILKHSDQSGNSPSTPDPAACLAYVARFIPDSASLDLTIVKMDTNEFAIPIFLGNIIIREGSYLKLVTGNDLRIAAYLNGALSIHGHLNDESSDKSSIQIPDIFFEGLYISNRAPYLTVERIHPLTKDSSQLGKFLFTFDEIAVVDHDPEKFGGQLKKMYFQNLRLDLGAITEGDALTISSNMSIYFAISSDKGRQNWRYRNLDIERFGFEGTLPGIDYVKGELAFLANHPTYGTGFAGGGTVRFGFIDAEVSMVCMFGNTGDTGFKYSYVDAALDLEKPLGDPSFKVYMLMAGYHKNMTRQELTKFKTGDLVAGEPGGQFPENRFMPAEDSWGIRGGLIARAGEGAIMGVRVVYERHPSEGQGISSRFLFEGLIELMPKGETTGSQATSRIVRSDETPGITSQTIPAEFAGGGAIGGYIRIHLIRDHKGRTFEAALGIHGSVGGMHINFYGEYYKSPEAWHLFVGRPDNRLELGYALADSDIVNASLSINAYFMMGNSEYMPKVLPPPYVKTDANYSNLRIAYDSLVSNPATNIFSNNPADLSTGKMIAFGAGLGLGIRIAIPEKQEWLLVEAGADIGFDLLMSRNTPECNTANISEVGINGWYFHGQMYAGVAAKIGIRIRDRSLKIFEGGACVLIQGAGFNPTWGVGTWRFYYKLLFLKGEAQGIFKFGQPCNQITSGFNPDKILESIYPSRPVTNLAEEVSNDLVSINSDFRMDFVIAADRRIPQTLTDFESGNTETFNIRLVSDIRLENQNGTLIQGDILYDNHGLTLVFRPKEMLTPGDRLILHVQSTIFDDKGIYSIDGKTFSVDTIVDYRVDPEGVMGLRSEDVAVSYPMMNQQYFHKDEYDQMMISFGKSLVLQNISLTSTLLRDENGHYEAIDNSDLEIKGIGLVQKVFNSLENQRKYRWVIQATSETGKMADIATIDFQTSNYALFIDKAKSVRISDLSLTSLDTRDSILPLQVSAIEELEFNQGNVITSFVGEKNIEEDLLVSNIDLPPGKIQSMIGINEVVGTSYFTRFQSSFSYDRSYTYFTEVYDHHLPYGTENVAVNCYVDDTPGAQENADPENQIQYFKMFPWQDQLLSLDGELVQYDILRSFSTDYLEFIKMTPQVPPYYAYCEPYSKGNIPYYIPGKYQLRIRYFIPGFEKYSSSNLTIDFNLVP